MTDLTAPVLLNIDCREGLAGLAGESVSCCVTSPPYWGLRDYKLGPDQLGMERTPGEYVAHLVSIFREVRRVLRSDGVCWVVIGDSSARDAKKGQHRPGDSGKQGYVYDRGGGRASAGSDLGMVGLKPKDICGIPWRLAFALQADGWYLRADIIWAKGASFGSYVGNPMPESVKDRPSRAHEYIFLLAKSERYAWDQEAVREAHARPYGRGCGTGRMHDTGTDNLTGIDRGGTSQTGLATMTPNPAGRNLRSVWTIPTVPFSARTLMAHGDAEFPDSDHFAVFPPDLVRPMILAGCPERVCPECGKPWARVTKRTGAVHRREPAHQPGNTRTKTDSTGWKPATVAAPNLSPTCACGRSDWLPGVVLDPFSGTGTTLLVAHALGRRSIGFDLSAAYCELARRRLAGPLFAEVAQPVMPPEPVEPGLFGEEVEPR